MSSSDPIAFHDMCLHETILRGLYTYGFETPSEIQHQSIPPMLQGRDVVGQAPSGTGKTGAFLTAVLSRLMNKQIECAVVLLHTKELATQCYTVATALSQYATSINTSLCVGGRPLRDNMKEIDGGANLLIGTPGRLHDLIVTKKLVNDIDCLIIDECDDILSGSSRRDDKTSFVDLLQDMLRVVHSTAQICMFSATMPESVVQMSQHFLRDPVKLLRPTQSLTLQGLNQYCITCLTDADKLAQLHQLFGSCPLSSVLIFCATRERVNWLKCQLEVRDFPVGRIHAQLSDAERREVMQRFRSGDVRVLVASSLIARGIDVQTVGLVIMFDINPNAENYLHTVGRAGRYGRKGNAISFVTQRDLPILSEIEAHYNITIPSLPANFQA